MLLCLDAGNTRLKFGLFDGGRWLLQDALDYAAFDELPARLPASPTRIVACNVAGQAVRQRIEALAGKLGLPLTWLCSTAAACGVTNSYDTPEQLGADRWAALIGARALHGGACVVAVAGTATTIDALDASGRFRGGLILPGLALMRPRSPATPPTCRMPTAVSGRCRPTPTTPSSAARCTPRWAPSRACAPRWAPMSLACSPAARRPNSRRTWNRRSARSTTWCWKGWRASARRSDQA
jgi:type III pantothenate kinase